MKNGMIGMASWAPRTPDSAPTTTLTTTTSTVPRGPPGAASASRPRPSAARRSPRARPRHEVTATRTRTSAAMARARRPTTSASRSPHADAELAKSCSRSVRQLDRPHRRRRPCERVADVRHRVGVGHPDLRLRRAAESSVALGGEDVEVDDRLVGAASRARTGSAAARVKSRVMPVEPGRLEARPGRAVGQRTGDEGRDRRRSCRGPSARRRPAVVWTDTPRRVGSPASVALA